MHHAPLQHLLATLQAARRAEDVFGTLEGDRAAQLEEGRRLFRTLARDVHPDHQADDDAIQEAATLAFQLLSRWWEAAQRSIEAGTYGARDAAAGVVVRSGKREYHILRTLTAGDISDVFLAESHRADRDEAPRRVIVKIARAAADADLVDNERLVLEQLWAAPADEVRVFGRYLPEPLDAFRLPDGRTALVVSAFEGYYSLAEVFEAYPDGVEVSAMAWMTRRTLELLAWVHRQGVVHGAVVPTHILIHPVTHGAALVDWSYATHGGRIQAISAAWRGYYPQEVFARQPATPATDLYMLSRVLVRLLGGDPATGELPASVPESIAGILRAAAIPNPNLRYNDAFELYKRFAEVLHRIYEPPKYHPFHMPERQS